jgi:hypothetical protein
MINAYTSSSTQNGAPMEQESRESIEYDENNPIFQTPVKNKN